MNLGYILPPVFLAAVSFVLLCIVLYHGWRNFINRVFSLFLLAFVLWGIFIFFMRSSPSLEKALIWDQLLVISTISWPVFFYHFSLLLTGAKRTKPVQFTLGAAYVLLFIHFALIPTDLFIEAMQLKPYGYAPIPGPLFFPHVAIGYTFFILSIINLVKGYRKATTSRQKNQFSYIITGISFSIILANFDFLPLFGLPLYPGGIIGNTLFVLLASIAVVKHRLLDINIIIRKGLAYGLISALIFGLYLGIASLILLTPLDNISPLLSAVIIVLLAMLFHPALERVQILIDRLFYRERYDYLVALDKFSKDTKGITDLRTLADSMIGMVSQAMHCARSCLLIPDLGKKNFYSLVCQGFESNVHQIIPFNSILARWLNEHDEILERERLSMEPRLRTMTAKEKKVLDDIKAELLIPLKTDEGVAAIIILGPKDSGGIYSDEDIRLLSIVSRQLAVALDNANLYETSIQSYKQLQKAQERVILSERLKALGEMTSGIAHDFNNALTTILGKAELSLIVAKKGKLNKQKITSDLETIVQATTDAAQMVRRLQDFARVRTDRPSTTVELNKVIQTAVTMIKPRLDQCAQTLDAKIDITLDLNEVNPVQGNEGELREVMVNILMNSFDAMPRGGKIAIRSEQRDSRAVISISDSGPGMTNRVKRRLFEPFFTTKGSNGLGMGLSVVYSIVSRYGGQIEVDSEVGKGTIFTILLPSAPAHSKKKVKKAIPAKVRAASLLVIDDDESPRHVLLEILSGAGYNVESAASGKDGLTLTHKKEYELVITDMGMPDISGKDIARIVKSASPRTRVILCTGWGIQVDETERKKLGIDEVINKPFERENLVSTVSRLLQS